ncbi:alpha/beta hydrolase [Zeaxanthinibacter sp. PT1]|uniref:alpha/beta hydrolase n=1 Tax=Zeaxanthinibacter TaxID=561554 RepID=UPI00234B5F89|nr:alpha/beta hydrolase [Zeaxanthinibacter sp. PT1]MDC6352580.1 alpha/beta hydrolase [Zeaxanthinibacter sp. PT1]
MKKHIQKYVPRVYGILFNSLSYVHPDLAAKQAFKTFSKVRKGRPTDEQQEFLSQASITTEIISGHQIQVYQWPGPGKTVLLVHGWESNSSRWKNLIHYLREAGFNIFAFDAPGHGNSTGKYLHVPLYSECVAYMVDKYHPKYIIGHSVGGMTTLYTHYRIPRLPIQKIVTIGSPSEFHEIMAHFKSLLTLNEKVMQSLEAYVSSRFGVRIEEFSSARFVKESKVPGLLFHDRFDTITPYHASESVHRHWQNSMLVTTEGLGHSMHQEEVNEQIISFLQQ